MQAAASAGNCGRRYPYSVGEYPDFRRTTVLTVCLPVGEIDNVLVP